MKALIIIDMQHDFIDGALGTTEAKAIVDNVAQKVKDCQAAGYHLIYTQDTHQPNYLDTQEGRFLPVEHCIKNTHGWQIVPEVWQENSIVIEKPAFGSLELADKLSELHPDTIELVGLCTDICVISNALILKARFPEIPVIVHADCCAGVSVESHQNALQAMRTCQVTVL